MLDLQQYSVEGYEIKLLDGRLVTVKKPSQQMLLQFNILTKEMENNKQDLEKVTSLVRKMVLEILNNNIEKEKVTMAQLLKYDDELLEAILNYYQQKITEVKNSPN